MPERVDDIISSFLAHALSKQLVQFAVFYTLPGLDLYWYPCRLYGPAYRSQIGYVNFEF